MTPSASSTFLNSATWPSQFHDIHTSEEPTTPMIIAPKLLTKPAARGDPTNPTIHPIDRAQEGGLALGAGEDVLRKDETPAEGGTVAELADTVYEVVAAQPDRSVP